MSTTAFERATDALGPIHALVAVSGIGGANAEDDEGGDRFDELVRTNLNGTYYCVRAALRHLAPGPEARHVVVISSILARIGVPGYTGYSASKAGLLGLVRSFAAELAPDGVQVNAICPGWVETDMAWSGLDVIAAAIGGTREDAYARRDARGAARAHVASRRTSRARSPGCSRRTRVASPARPSTRTAAPGWAEVPGGLPRPSPALGCDRAEVTSRTRASIGSSTPSAASGGHVRDRARAVVIGGGVGGCSILYWLARLGWDDVVLVERADLTSGSTFHSAGLVGQLRSSLSLTRMMMDARRPVPDADRRGRARDRVAGGRLAAARLVGGAPGGDHAPGGLGEDVRPAARADLAERGAGALPADDDRRRAGRRVPADRRLHRPEPADVRARRGRAAARGRGRHVDARDGHPHTPRPRRGGRDRSRRDRDRGRRQRRRHVRPRDRRARGRHRADRADGARVPRAEAERASRSRCRRCATRRCSCTSGPSRAA